VVGADRPMLTSLPLGAWMGPVQGAMRPIMSNAGSRLTRSGSPCGCISASPSGSAMSRAGAELGMEGRHRPGRYVREQPRRKLPPSDPARERKQQMFKSQGSAQRFLPATPPSTTPSITSNNRSHALPSASCVVRLTRRGKRPSPPESAKRPGIFCAGAA